MGGHKRGENIKGEEEEKEKKKRKTFSEIEVRNSNKFIEIDSTSIPCNNSSLEPRALKARPREI